MMSDNSRRRTASRLHAYIGAVIVGGIAAIISTFFLQSQQHWGPKPSGFVFLAVLLLVSETQPMRFVRLHEGSDITISWTFAFALVLLTPVGALVVMAVASILGDLLRRKPLIRLAFNAGQMVCSLAVAALVLLLPHGFDLLETSHPSPIWFLVVGLAAICAFVTNIVLTTTVLAIHEGISPRPMMRRAVHSNLSTDGMLLALAPVFAIAAIQNLYLVPLLVAAVWNVYRAASLALRRQHEASHDALTDLPNRRQFFEHATHELAHAVRSGRSFAVAVLDLDGFKEINDRLGHHTGDLVLQEVAKRLNASRRGSDIAARFGGDEFALLLVDVDGADGAFSAVERTHEFMTQPCVVGGFPLKLAGSFGVAVYPEHGTSIDELLHHADEAMYEAKKSDSSVKRFSAPRHENHGRLALLAELERERTVEELERAGRRPRRAAEPASLPLFDAPPGAGGADLPSAPALPVPPPARSAPAQKPRPVPVSSTQRIAASVRARSICSRNDMISAWLMALSRCGRLRVRVSTPPSRVARTGVSSIGRETGMSGLGAPTACLASRHTRQGSVKTSTGSGTPLGSRKEINASPTPSSTIASAALNFGFGRKVSAAVFTAFWSFGVKARSACCTRLPSWPSTASGMSSGFWVTK